MQITNGQSKWIPDANQWTYSNLTKQKWISDANQWTYTNLLKQKETWIPDANQWTYTSLPPYHRNNCQVMDLCLSPPWTKLATKQSGYRMPINGLTPIS